MFRFTWALGPLLICVLVCVVAPPAAAQVGSIIIASDLGGSDCAFVDTAPALQPVYVFHMYTGGTVGSRFRLDVEGLGWTFLGDQTDFLALGNSIDGIMICYEACLSGSFQILTANFFGSGIAPVCSRIRVVPYPGLGVEAQDCDMNLGYAGAGEAIVNPDVSCQCTACRAGTDTACALKPAPADAVQTMICGPVPVQQSTWGAIKTLYR